MVAKPLPNVCMQCTQKLYLILFTEHARNGASYWRSIMYACNALKLYLILCAPWRLLLAQYNVCMQCTETLLNSIYRACDGDPCLRSIMYARNARKLYLILFTEHAHHGASYWRSIMYACHAPALGKSNEANRGHHRMLCE